MVELVDVVDLNHSDRNAEVPIWSWLVVDRRDVSLAIRIVVIETHRVEDAGCQEDHLVVSKTCCWAPEAAPCITNAFHAQVGLDEMCFVCGVVLLAVCHEGWDIGQRPGRQHLEFPVELKQGQGLCPCYLDKIR